ncbi:MAG TPA: phosphatase PAP2 family protein [Bacillales bacterium]|nr:phosphatase PAP2 family protein [Bacillales bacterium]
MSTFNKTPYLALLLIFPILGYIYGNLNENRSDATILLTKLDSIIPFLPIFILPYILWYVFILAYLIYFWSKDTKLYIRTLAIIVLGEIVSFIIYYFFQTTIPRPALSDKGFLINLVQIIYLHDQPYNCFPSIHVLTTFSIILSSFHIKNKHIFHTFLIPISGFLIIISTLFVKQHGILDILGSIFLAFFMYGIIFPIPHAKRNSKQIYLRDGIETHKFQQK